MVVACFVVCENAPIAGPPTARDRDASDMSSAASPLLTDLYQLNMIEAYLAEGETRPAVFEFVVRRLPHRRGFLVAAGLEQALEFLETLRLPAVAFGRLQWDQRLRKAV